MQEELKNRLLRFLEKIVNSLPGVEAKTIEAEAFLLEMQVRMSNRNLTLETPVELVPILGDLTESQAVHYESIRWLLDPMGPRAVGKTHLMALAFIQHSLYYGTWVRIYDHGYHINSTQEMLERITCIVGRMKGIRLTFRNPTREAVEIKVARIQDEIHKPFLKGTWDEREKISGDR